MKLSLPKTLAIFLTSQLLTISAAQAWDGCFEVSAIDMGCASDEVVTNLGCETHDNLRCVKEFTAQEKQDYVIGKVKKTYSGKIDPQVLGEVTLALIEGDVTTVIMEPLEDAWYLEALKALSDNDEDVEVVVGIPRSTLQSVQPGERREMLQRARRLLGLSGDAETLEILD